MGWNECMRWKWTEGNSIEELSNKEKEEKEHGNEERKVCKRKRRRVRASRREGDKKRGVREGEMKCKLVDNQKVREREIQKEEKERGASFNEDDREGEDGGIDVEQQRGENEEVTLRREERDGEHN